jgi:hypothetical protein
MTAASVLNVAGLLVSTLSAGLMYYFPPRGVAQYTDDGRPVVAWAGEPSEQGVKRALWQRRLSRLAPLLLAVGLAMQLVAAIVSA